ncbi:zinc finger protein 569-like isoform X2 [Ambystoma mexicanum]|uniref:zinc finger protein 569-like isoform X2 n=1 Tax=Ambystoma mexicanum TaxID=8296 RepID=UPI0037E9ACF3
MSEQDSKRVAFTDASACFSDEEWALLHEWQKDLYRNVMKEIHQALMSLGPLIATTVSSLREKEKEEMCLVEKQYLKRRHRLNRSPCDTMGNLDVTFRINKKEPPYQKSAQPAEGRLRTPHPSTGFPQMYPHISLKEEEPVSIFIDHLGAEIEESCIDPNSGYELVSLQIKDEDGTYCTENKDRDGVAVAGTSHPMGDETMIGKHKGRRSVKPTGKATQCRTPLGSAKVKTAQIYEKVTQSSSQLSEMAQEIGEEMALWESSFSNSNHYSFHHEPPEEQRSQMYDDGANLCNQNLFASLPNLQPSVFLYSCTECGKDFGKKEDLIRHKRIHMGVRPYQCTECDKSFRRKDTLFVHKRTHTGERPYHCAMCEKSFNQVGALNRHKRTHLGYRPYQCHQCEKSFSQNGTLIAHQKTHNDPKKRLLPQM